MTQPQRVVAEVSITWHGYGSRADGDTISRRFEHVIGVNLSRGLRLESWQLATSMSANGKTLVETIVAVFVAESPT